MASYFFSCFTVKILKNFRVITTARERSRQITLKAMSIGRLRPFADAETEFPPVITADVIRSISTMSLIVLNRFIFFIDMFVVLVVL